MVKRVAVVASGYTELSALPCLLANLSRPGAAVRDVKVYIPPRGRPLDVPMAEKLIRSAWFGGAPMHPDKIVVLVDTDKADPTAVTEPLREELPKRLKGVGAHVLICHAQQHLEAWYFGDAENLRTYLGRALGRVDPTRPDEIVNPKLHLKNLLGRRPYTVEVSESIARTLNANTIAARSPSFRGFVEALENGGVHAAAR